MAQLLTEDQEELTAIWPPFQAFYISSMLFSTTSALRSVSLLSKNLERLKRSGSDSGEVSRFQKTILDGLQNVIGQGAALSRYFWPVRDDELHLIRAARLKRALLVNDDNVLRDRELRNAIEHFDERLDHYLTGNVVGYVMPEYVGPTPEQTGVHLHLFRAYFFDTGTFEILGKRFEIEPIIMEIDRIHGLLVECEKSGSSFNARPEAEQKSVGHKT